MNEQTESLKMALETLQLAKASHGMMYACHPPKSAWLYHDMDMKITETITAIKKALASSTMEASK